MPARRYDAIVVGARAAGAATAMLLSRTGREVLVVDRSEYGSDTLSTHALMRAGVLQLHRWGLLDRVIAEGTPPVRSTTFHYPDTRVPIPIKPAFGVDALYAPRRTVLDRILVDAAREAGAEIRHGVTVTDLARADDGRVTGIVGRAGGEPVVAHADLVIGADGMRSRVAELVGAPTTHAAAATTANVYRYFADLNVDLDGYQWHYAPGAAAGLVPTNGGVCAFVSVPPERYAEELAGAGSVDGGFWRVMTEASPELVDLLGAATPVDRYHRFPGLRGHVRRPGGPGWALVGDAGYFKDPSTAHGISDALRDAELLVRALDSHPSAEAATAAFEEQRNRLSLDLFRITDRISSFEWSISEVRRLLLQLSDAMSEEVELLSSLDSPAGVPTTAITTSLLRGRVSTGGLSGSGHPAAATAP